MSSYGPQRQRHGVTRNLVDGIGGLVVGAAVVLLAAQWLKRRQPQPAAAASQSEPVVGETVAPRSRTRRTPAKTSKTKAAASGQEDTKP